MNKNTNFSEKTQYASPSCKTVVLEAREIILADSLNGGRNSMEKMNRRDVSGWSWDNEN